MKFLRRGEGARLRWFNRSVLGFGLASFLSDAGHEAATAAMPALLVTLGAAPAALGLIEGIADGLSSFAKVAGGWLADEPRRRKPIALAACATPSVALLVFLFAVAGLTLAFEHTLEGTLTAHLVPPGLRGTGYGVLATTNGLGDLLSSALVGVLWTTYGPRIAFGAAAVPCLAGALLLLFTGSMRREIP